MAAPPLCDRVDVKVKGAGRSSTTLCAPALFIAGVGKCGTNSLAEHLSRHPQLIGMSHELPWDPLETPPQRMVRYRHVLPNSSKSWLVKHPKYSFAQVGPLARRLREAYPSARVALTLCDPAKLTWRRFAYAVSQSLTLHGSGAGEPSTFRAFVAALAELNTSLGRLFDGVMPVGADGAQCVQSGATSALLDRLSARGFKLLYSSSWLSTGEAGRKGCLREWAMVNGYATTVDGWSRAGFGVNRSLGVVFMEGWERDGPEYVVSAWRRPVFMPCSRAGSTRRFRRIGMSPPATALPLLCNRLPAPPATACHRPAAALPPPACTALPPRVPCHRRRLSSGCSACPARRTRGDVSTSRAPCTRTRSRRRSPRLSRPIRTRRELRMGRGVHAAAGGTANSTAAP